MKGTLRALVLLLVIGTLMVPAIGMSIEEQGDTEENEDGEEVLVTDDTTSDLQPLFTPLTTVFGALIMLLVIGILFSWLGVIG